MTPKQDWLALVIGNSRFHWAYFQDRELQQTWDSSEEIIPPDWRHLCLYIASVVDSKITLFSEHPYQRIIELTDIPLEGMYSTLGVDRALALWGAIDVWGYPCLVVDSGTALTFTGANQDRQFHGGSIVPGLGLQLNSLALHTAALSRVSLPDQLPPLWARTTPEAISSGVIYTVLGGIYQFLSSWWREFPDSTVLFTGGDGELLRTYLTQFAPEIAAKVQYDGNLAFWGMRSLVTG